MPLLLVAGIYLLEDRKYYWVSLLMMAWAIALFLTRFENRKPKARELVVVSVLSALAVAGRAAFFMLPQFKPVAAVVIIAGACLGAETGFLVGVTAGFVSNFFFGQGPWTPWQMFCFGLVGIGAGMVFEKWRMQKKRLPLCIYGGLATFFLYGGIINIGALLIFNPEPTWKAMLAMWASGFWFDMVHSFSTVFFLYWIAEPMVEKLERIKVKHGLME